MAFGNVGDHGGRRNFEADLAADVLEEQAIFGDVDGVELRANQFHAVFIENAGFGELDGEVQAGLAADGGKHGVGAFGGDDGFEIFLR